MLSVAPGIQSSARVPGTVREELVARNDRELTRLVRATAEGAAEREIERLILEVAQPLSSEILSRYVRPGAAVRLDDAEDISGAITVRLISRLRAVTESPDDAIADFRGYVAALTYNAINDHLRRAFPARARLKNRIRYVLLRDARLGLWSGSGTLVCGLASWANTAVMPGGAELAVDDRRISRVMLDRDRPGDAVAALLALIGGPVPFESLVTLVARLWQVGEVPLAARDAEEHAAPDAVSEAEQRNYLAVLWREIRELLPMQRKALLLNLRNAEATNVASLLVLTGTTRFDELAATLELTPEQLAAIWKELPLDDLRIAELLQVTRQQVINLRKSARDRLARRMMRTKGSGGR